MSDKWVHHEKETFQNLKFLTIFIKVRFHFGSRIGKALEGDNYTFLIVAFSNIFKFQIFILKWDPGPLQMHPDKVLYNFDFELK